MNKRALIKGSIVLMDFIAFFTIYFVSLFIVNNFTNEKPGSGALALILGFSLLKILVHFFQSSYNHLWIYRTKNDYIRLTITCACCNIVVFIAFFLMHIFEFDELKFNALLVAFMAEILYLYTTRLSMNYISNRRLIKKNISQGFETLIVGAGSAGAMIMQEIQYNTELDYNVIGFLDDDEGKIGKLIDNKRVYGPISRIDYFIKLLNIKKVIIAMPSVGRVKIQEITNQINYKDVEVLVVPPIINMLHQGLNSTLRKVSIADLLGRTETIIDNKGIEDFIEDKCILVTGGSGSIGSEIVRQVCKYKPKRIIVFDIYENTTYTLEVELDTYFKKHPYTYRPEIITLIGSVRDEVRLENLFKQYSIDIVFHAAAHKHVPLMEDSPKEAIKNNVIGTYNVCKYADLYKAKKVVLISTDKAVNPTNVMGASKRFAEMVIEAFNKESKNTSYSMVRFGNVLGSNGSVIPLFERQIQEGGPLTVTSEEINRFFMTIPEACSLVIESGSKANGGEKFILDMGEPVKIIDLAKQMIKLSGLEIGKDITIEITGLRPGEKLYEELLLDTTKCLKTDNEKIFIEKSDNPFSINEINQIIKELLELEPSNKTILDYLRDIEIKKNDLKIIAR